MIAGRWMQSDVGLTPGRMMRSVGAVVNGTQVGEIFQDQKIFGVVVRGAQRLSADVTSLHGLMIDTPSGAQVPLKVVADIRVVPAPNEIKREGASRRIDITCNVDGLCNFGWTGNFNVAESVRPAGHLQRSPGERLGAGRRFLVEALRDASIALVR